MPEGLKISDAKVQSLKEWPKPTTIQQVQSFLGFVQFFHKFIKGFSKLQSLCMLLHIKVLVLYGMKS